jgi:type I restriction enzyme S subunit
MKVKTIPSAWMRREGRRLDCGPYLSDALGAKIRLEEMSCKKERLANLCAGGEAGLVNAGRITRRWVEDPSFGLPFLTSTSILQADLSDLRFISKRAVLANPQLIIRHGYTLITRAGTIGRMSYTRPDMDGMACTEDVLRAIPDDQRVRPGYLYAFLSSKYGVPLVTSGTYGAIIQHIEPQHIADLPVPRLGDKVERIAHELVDGAASNRVRAADLLSKSISQVRSILGIPTGPQDVGRGWTSVASSRMQARFDAYYFSTPCESARQSFDAAKVNEHCCLSKVAEVFIPGIFKRRYSEESRFGVPYITGGDVFQLAPKSDRYLMRRVVSEYRLGVEEGTILIQEAGQLGGLIGRSVMVGSYLDGFAVSNNMVRVKALDRRDAGFLFALLSTEEGVRLITREAAGSSIPHMDASRLCNLRLPWPIRERRHEVSAFVDEAIKLRDMAAASEDEARTLVERSIEEAT